MKAFLSFEPGPPETLQLCEVEQPSPGATEVLIRVGACALNHPDLLVIEDRYQYRPPRPFAPGSEVAGTVEAVGTKVKRLKRGDRVVAHMYYGGLAEQAIALAENVAPLPPHRSFVEGASLLLPYGTAYHALRDRGGLRPGETLLVLGAAGGVGLAAVEIGKAMGARVAAAISSTEKVQAVREAGADEVLVYQRPPFSVAHLKSLASDFKSLVGPNGADVIFDPVGGPYTEAAIRAIGWEGRFLTVGFTAGIPSLPLNLLLMKRCQAIGVFWGPYMERFPDRYSGLVRGLFTLWDEGKISPRLAGRFPLSAAGDAFRLFASGEAVGRVVIEMD